MKAITTTNELAVALHRAGILLVGTTAVDCDSGAELLGLWPSIRKCLRGQMTVAEVVGRAAAELDDDVEN